MTLQVALEALHHDADSWERVAAVTRQAAQAASQLTLSAHELSWAALPTGLLDTYAELQRKAVTLVEEASEIYSGLSLRLDKVAALVSLVVGLIGAIGSSATVFGLPAAPFIAAGAAVTASVTLIVGCETLKHACTSANSTLRQKFDDTGSFRGRWPPAGTA
ncbi:hypothetical protein [Actinoplanes derwentensis]|uniref:Uncharacterized protein n=1 Tax=Actinoplanes derwentensis TaxID=113562 RepID=A0A1H1T6R1_9ACTN|nr:hypothetical protein [Actinoplanes derwentensis]GID89001.1 hypothetical protein Ade03nite_79250 [Actinoplanes derwentensis]SDS55935.1 hypothetical protein SAMN04489716_1054 [Actinoplanes derwentensis]